MGTTVIDSLPRELWLDEFLDAFDADYMLMVRAYFDESGTHDDAEVTCVAGYLFDKKKARCLNREWHRVLARFGLTHFHMVDCAHGTGEFKKLSLTERVKVQTHLIEIIKNRAVIGIAVSVKSRDFFKVFEGDPYVLCLTWCLAGVASWVHTHKFNGRIAYFFEAGHASQSTANNVMANMTDSLSLGCRYYSHAFIGKNDAVHLQAADLLAWQWQTDFKRSHANPPKARRADLSSLLKLRHISNHLTIDKLLDIAEGGTDSVNLRMFRVVNP